MLVKIEYTFTAPSTEIIDLKDYGYDAEKSWEDLTYEEQNEITDSLSIQYDVIAGGEEIQYNGNESYYADYYDEEELEIILNK